MNPRLMSAIFRRSRRKTPIPSREPPSLVFPSIVRSLPGRTSATRPVCPWLPPVLRTKMKPGLTSEASWMASAWGPRGSVEDAVFRQRAAPHLGEPLLEGADARGIGAAQFHDVTGVGEGRGGGGARGLGHDDLLVFRRSRSGARSQHETACDRIFAE